MMIALDLRQLEWLFYGLLAALAVIVGALIAYVVIANRRQRARMRASYEADRMAPRPATRVTGQILSLVRREYGGPLEVEIGGTTYSNLAEIEDPQVRRQVVGSALELIQFTGALEQASGTLPLVDESSTWREDLRQSSQAELGRIQSRMALKTDGSERPQVPDEVEEQFLSLLTEMGQPAPAPEKPSVMGALRRRRVPKIPKQEDSRSFVDDIEEIVQRKLHIAPALAGRGLHVRLGEDGSVRFLFEGREYGSLEELPNLTAQQLVQDAIDEWDEMV
jgi:hypothetical protein